jgi:hypothetical protein
MTDPNVPNDQPDNSQQPVPPTPAVPPAPAYGAPQGAPVPPPAPQYGAPQAPPVNPYGQPYAAAPAQKSPVLSIIALIAGILGLFTSWFFFGGLFSIAAIVLGFLGKNKEPQAKGMWLTGIILGFVGVLVLVIVIIFTIIVFAAAASMNVNY